MSAEASDSSSPKSESTCERIIRSIDEVLEMPPPSIEDAVMRAVERGTMTIREASECIDAYYAAFHAPE